MTLIHICEVQTLTNLESKKDNGQINIVYCNMTFIHICNVHYLINLEIDVDIGQIHIT